MIDLAQKFMNIMKFAAATEITSSLITSCRIHSFAPPSTHFIHIAPSYPNHPRSPLAVALNTHVQSDGLFAFSQILKRHADPFSCQISLPARAPFSLEILVMQVPKRQLSRIVMIEC